MSKKDDIARKNARPYITCYLDPNAANAFVVSIPKGAKKVAIRRILQDAAQMAGVRL